MRNTILLLVTLFIANPAFAQYEADTESIQSTIDALYEVISGDAGVERDWDRFKNLFIDDAKLIPTGKTQQGEVVYRYWTPEEYIEIAGASLEREWRKRQVHPCYFTRGWLRCYPCRYASRCG